MHKRFILFILSVMLVALTFRISISAQEPENPIIEVDPTKIEVMIPAEDIPRIPNATVYITARQANLTRISINSTDLFEEQNRRFWIPADSINFSRNHFNLTEGHTINVKVRFSLPADQPPGAYVGRIILRSENGGRAELPITIKLRTLGWQPFAMIAAGVLANLVISISRWRIEDQDSAKAAIELADSAIYQAEDDGRRDDRYTRAVNLQEQYREDYKFGDFKVAREKASRAKFEAEHAKKQKPPTNEDGTIDLLQMTGPICLQSAYRIAPRTIIDKVRAERQDLIGARYERVGEGLPQKIWSFAVKYLRVAQKSGLVYLALTVIIGVVMLQAWEAFYPRIIDFGASSIDYVTAFLYGFSGQAFLGAFADLGKRWLA